MFSDIGTDSGMIDVDLAKIADLRNAITALKESPLYTLYLSDLEKTDRALMRAVKIELPENMFQEKAREQNLGQALMLEKMREWFDVADEKLDEYHKQQEQDNGH